MNNRDDDAAFPRLYSEQQPGDRKGFCYAQQGMSMREWYAGMALSCLRRSDTPSVILMDAELAAKFADATFIIADAMIERAKR